MTNTTTAFSASDAQVRVTDDSTRLEKALSSVEYYERELAAAIEVVARLTQKAVKYKAHYDEIVDEIEEAEAYVSDLREQRGQANELVRNLTGEES